MRRRSLSLSAGGLVLARVVGARAEAPRAHRIALHVGGGDVALMGVALHNIANAIDAYAEKGETVTVELVANGPGYTMLRADTSPVKAELAELHRKYPFVVFSACQLSRKGAAAAEHKRMADIPEVPEARGVPAGIVRLTELQEQGFSYLRV